MQHNNPNQRKIVSIKVEETDSYGNTYVSEVSTSGYFANYVNSETGAEFWLASSLKGVTSGVAAIAGGAAINEMGVDCSLVKSRENTMIGIIRDGASNFCFVGYDIQGTVFSK